MSLKNGIYWLGVVLLGVPAVAGVAVAAFALMLLTGLIISLVFLICVFALVCVLPVGCWCAALDNANFVNVKTFATKGAELVSKDFDQN